jgi:hypothetical protein
MPPGVTKLKAAMQDADLSKRQAKTMMGVARVPEAEVSSAAWRTTALRSRGTCRTDHRATDRH